MKSVKEIMDGMGLAPKMRCTVALSDERLRQIARTRKIHEDDGPLGISREEIVWMATAHLAIRDRAADVDVLAAGAAHVMVMGGWGPEDADVHADVLSWGHDMPEKLRDVAAAVAKHVASGDGAQATKPERRYSEEEVRALLNALNEQMRPGDYIDIEAAMRRLRGEGEAKNHDNCTPETCRYANRNQKW